MDKEKLSLIGLGCAPIYPCVIHSTPAIFGPERSQAIIRHMLDADESHAYTITKQGRRKLIFQTPWREDGQVRGLVEFSFVLPDEMPHYDRDAQK